MDQPGELGGSYLAASGLPVQRLDHASRMVDFAQDMLRLVQRVQADRGLPITVRIGIASGSVLAGIVGETRLTFDVWGEIVDLAKALAARADSGTVLVSTGCHDLLADLYRFDQRLKLGVTPDKTVTAWPLSPQENGSEPAALASIPAEAASHV